jgi:methionyl-tRNA synthetase
MTTFITVAIPYVNADPHIGYAFELVDADLAARARRAAGEDVRFLGGTDDYSLKNVLAAEQAGIPTRDFVDRHSEHFVSLGRTLGISFDDFIRTSSDPRHRPAVERLWHACAASGDLHRRSYEGFYCVGCEQFYGYDELSEGLCAEHGTAPDVVEETNWFFRLSRYQERLSALIESGRLKIEPEPYRNEILAFLRAGLRDISVSRSATRARGWGIGVPGDETQVIYVWFDALTNYISALGYGSGSDDYSRWWRDADERVHVVGKGITRFHALYWPAFLISAGEPPPTQVHVHPYLTEGGRKVSKSSGTALHPADLVDRWGLDAVRWWFASEPAATSDTDFTEDRLVARANTDLANGLGNAAHRVSALIDRYRGGAISTSGARPLVSSVELHTRVCASLSVFDRQGATCLVTEAVRALNQDIEARAPWQLAKDPLAGDALDELLACYVLTLEEIGRTLTVITPDLARRLLAHLATPAAGVRPGPVQPRLER